MSNNNPERSNNSNGSGTLEQRAAAALNDATIKASALAELVDEVENGVSSAEAIALRMQELAEDPTLSLDAVKSAEAATMATLVVKRLRHILPRLQERHQATAAHERRIRWNQAADVVQGERDAMAAEFAEQYPALVSQLVDLFERLRVTDASIDGINSAAPNAESRRLESFGHQPILTSTKLLSLTGELLWPPPPPPINVNTIAPRLPAGGDWHATIAERDAQRHREAVRVAEYHNRMAREKEDKENAAARAARLRNGAAP